MNFQAARLRCAPPQRAMRKYIGMRTISKARKNSMQVEDGEGGEGAGLKNEQQGDECLRGRARGHA